jgi:putative tricarboxylic transport membrane protein
LFRDLGFPSAPLILAMVVGPIIETSLRQSMKMAQGDISVLIFRPICFTLYLAVLALFIVPLLARKFKRRIKSPESSHRESSGD